MFNLKLKIKQNRKKTIIFFFLLSSDWCCKGILEKKIIDFFPHLYEYFSIRSYLYCDVISLFPQTAAGSRLSLTFFVSSFCRNWKGRIVLNSCIGHSISGNSESCLWDKPWHQRHQATTFYRPFRRAVWSWHTKQKCTFCEYPVVFPIYSVLLFKQPFSTVEV